MRAPVALMLLRNEGPLRPGNDNMRYRLQVFFGDRCGSHCRATTFDEATLLPLTPQLRTCSGGSDRFTLSANALNRCRDIRCAGCSIEGCVAERRSLGWGARS